MNELSTTANFKIDEGFKNLIPPLSDEEYSQLEQNCTKYGIRDALTVCKFPGSENLLLLDGHNRFEIAKKCNLAYKTERLDFESREAAEEWIIKNQLGRRNIQPYVRAELALKLKPIIEKQAHQRKIEHVQNSSQAKTRDKLAQAAGVSHDTIHKVEVIKEKADPEVIDKLRKGETTIHKEYVNIMAAEHENRRQAEARKLREAKERRKEFESYLEECAAEDADNIVSFNSIKQNNDDKELIFQDFNRGFESAIDGIRSYAGMIDSGRFKESIEMANKYELERLADHAQQLFRAALKIQKVIMEVADEK